MSKDNRRKGLRVLSKNCSVGRMYEEADIDNLTTESALILLDLFLVIVDILSLVGSTKFN